MAAPTLVATGTPAYGTAGVNVSWPSHQEGDLGILVIETDDGGVTLTPSGWTHVANSPFTDTGISTKLNVLYKWAASGSEAAVATGDSGDHQSAVILVFRNTAGVDVTGTTLTTDQCPTVTTTGDDAMVVLIASGSVDGSGTAEFSAWANANLASLAEAVEMGSANGTGTNVGIATGTMATAGATGATTLSYTGATTVGFTVALLGGYPYVNATATNETAYGTSHVATMPTHVAGDLLLVYAISYDNLNAIPEGWTALVSNVAVGTYAGQIVYKRATSASESLTLTSPLSDYVRFLIFTIKQSEGPPVISSSATGSSTIPNPPSLTPSFGTQKTLWLASEFHGAAVDPVTAYPSGYTWNETNNLQNIAYIGVATKAASAASEDPGTFTLTSSGDWVAYTIGIRGVTDDALVAVAPAGVSATAAAALSVAVVDAPRLREYATSASGGVNPLVVSLPELIAGDLAIIWVGSTYSLTTPTGWTRLDSEVWNAYRANCFYRRCDGSEGSSVSITASAAGSFEAIAFRVTVGRIPVASTGAYGTTQYPAPPSSSPGSTADWTYITMVEHSTTTLAAGPSGYTRLASMTSQPPWVAVDYKYTTSTSSDTPSSYTLGTEASWVAQTLAIEPSGRALVGSSDGVSTTPAADLTVELSYTLLIGSAAGESTTSAALARELQIIATAAGLSSAADAPVVVQVSLVATAADCVATVADAALGKFKFLVAGDCASVSSTLDAFLGRLISLSGYGLGESTAIIRSRRWRVWRTGHTWGDLPDVEYY